MNSIIVKLFPVHQKGNVFYTGKIRVDELIKIATVNVRGREYSDDSSYLDEVKHKMNIPLDIQLASNGVQRAAEKNRLVSIAKYIDSEDALFPGSIIVSVHHKNDEEIGYILEGDINGEYKLTVFPDKTNVFVIDGQHRLGGFAYAEEDEPSQYEVPIAVFFGLSVPIQANLFATINGNQKPVSKSLLYDLLEYGDREFETLAKCHIIAKWFQLNDNSPLKGKIKMLGKGEGNISQSAFVDALNDYLKDRTANRHKSFLVNRSEEEIINILRSYFLGIKKGKRDEWKNPKEYNLLNTTGFGAFMKALYYIYAHSKMQKKPFVSDNLAGNFSEVPSDLFEKQFQKGVAGQGSQKLLMKKIVVYYFKPSRNYSEGDFESIFKDIEVNVDQYYKSR